MIRGLRDDDIPALTALWRELRPDAVHSPLGLRHLVKSFPERAQAAHWVVEDDEQVVAWCFAHRRWWRAGNAGYVWVGVLPEQRQRSLGGTLWKLAEEHVAGLGLERVNTDVVGDEAGARFLERRGFRPYRSVVISHVDPRRVDVGDVEPPTGYALATYAELDPHALYELDKEAGDDSPGEDAPHDVTFEEWEQELLRQPDLVREASFAVLHGGRPVAYSALSVDREGRRGRNEGTGTARAHRGRGLATLAKRAQLRWAAEQGIERVITDNDEGNAPMLAINRKLGYEPFVERQGYFREL